MALNLFDSKGVRLEEQRFTWRDMVQNPVSKLDDDAFTRVRVILAAALEPAFSTARPGTTCASPTTAPAPRC